MSLVKSICKGTYREEGGSYEPQLGGTYSRSALIFSDLVRVS